MKKAIEISVLRVSSNGKYIEFIINCPEDYFFTDFTINVLGKEDEKYSLKDCLFKFKLLDEESSASDESTGDLPDWIVRSEIDGELYYNKHYYSGQFKVEDLGVTVPEIYEVHLTAEHNESADSDLENELEEDQCWNIPLEIYATAYISDVAKAYNCIMDDILTLGEKVCGDDEVMDRVIRNYLILYAHQEAMHLHYLDDARRYFTLLSKCFSTCGDGNRRYAGATCNLCNGGVLTESVRLPMYKPSCGCKR